MARKVEVDDILINTIIGTTTKISGDLSVSGVLRVDGDIDGNVSATGRIFMGNKARIRGSINAPSIIVGGIVCGNVIASEAIEVLPTGMILGAVLTTSLTVHEDVIIHGFCSALKDREHFLKLENEHKNKRALKASAFSRTSL